MSDTDVLADIKQEGKALGDVESVADLFADDEQENETSEESQPEENKTEDDPTQEGEEAKEEDKEKSEAENTLDEKLEPFHKHPRWKKMEQKLEDAERIAEEAQKTANQPQQPVETEMPQWFKTLAGDDDVAKQVYKEFQEHTAADQKALEERMRAEFKAEGEKALKEEEQWNTWRDTEVANLKEQGLKFDTNKLMKVALEWQPTNAEGNIDLKKAYDIMVMQSGSKPNADAKKKVAAKTASTNQGGETSKPKTLGSNDLRSRSFSSLVQPKQE